MTPERYNRVFELFLAACEREPELRGEFLSGACPDDPDILREVTTLLEFDLETSQITTTTQTREPPLPPGTFIGNGYCIDVPIGQGGMGVVYRAQHLETDETVAIKILSLADAENPALLDTIEREARAIMRLTHPNVVRIHEWGDAPQIGPFLVMEIIEGPTLDRELRRRGHFDLDKAIDLTSQICAGVQAAHDAGVIHRDLKPQNISLVALPDGGFRVKVLDFGLAKLQNPDALDRDLQTLTGALVGSPHYMSPEQCRGLLLDARSDVYSLGCILYAMLTGRPPFPGDSTALVMTRQVDEPPSPPSSLSPTLSPELDAVLLRALSKRPDERYPTAAALQQAVAATPR